MFGRDTLSYIIVIMISHYVQVDVEASKIWGPDFAHRRPIKRVDLKSKLCKTAC